MAKQLTNGNEAIATGPFFAAATVSMANLSLRR